MWDSLKEHFAVTLGYWWAVVPMTAGSIIGLLIDAAPGFKGGDLSIPWWVWLAIALTGIPIAQFLAFHKMRTARDELKDERDDLRNELDKAESKRESALVRGDVTSIGQMGGQTAGVIANIGQQQRTLKNVGIEPIIARLSAFQGTQIRISSLMGNAESYGFAEEISALLQKAGWAVRGISQEVYGTQPKGVILFHPSSQPDAAMEEVGRCLLELGFRVSHAANPVAGERLMCVGAV